jgi:hypothetical protein
MSQTMLPDLGSDAQEELRQDGEENERDDGALEDDAQGQAQPAQRQRQGERTPEGYQPA